MYEYEECIWWNQKDEDGEIGNQEMIQQLGAPVRSSFRCELHPTYREYMVHTYESSRKALCKGGVGATRELKWKLYYRVDPHPYIASSLKSCTLQMF